jgi:D-alanyl-D-alanine carboxypeptidase
VEQLRQETGFPAISAAIIERDGPVRTATAGPIDEDTPFFIGSISKNVFATILLLLAEEGKINLEDPLSKYVKWPRGDEITLRMLLNHTSGIPDYLAEIDLATPHPPRRILAIMREKVLRFEPGTSQAYSNTNGVLVGEVIRKVTGMTLAAVLQERIVEPLGLENTCLYGETHPDRDRARGYREEDGKLVDCSHLDEALPDSADGSILTTAKDLIRYHRALRGGELIGPDSWKAMRHVAPGTHNGLAYLIGEGPSGRHEGSVGRSMGHLSANLYLVDREMFIVILLNRGDAPLPLRRFLELRYGPY